jgi:hypothetical protein
MKKNMIFQSQGKGLGLGLGLGFGLKRIKLLNNFK